MAVLLETSKGDIVIDLLVDDCPLASKNFLKLCKIKYYNNCLFHNVQQNFILQTGDPTGTGKGGTSIYGKLYGDQARFFEDEVRPHLKHRKRGVVGMASPGEGLNASQFYITAGEELDSLDGKHTVFGQVAEGWDVLDAINEAFVDPDGRPYQNIRIRHTIVLDDPFPDPPELEDLIPPASPPPEFGEGDRLEDDWVPTEDTRPAEEAEAEARRAEAHHRAVVLEMVGDLPDADAKPPSSMLFVCKLNPVTDEEALEIIFSRFGRVTSCDIIRDFKTGDSLNYGFIGFDSDEACEAAYFKMNNAVVDDRRIRVDFSQSVSHLWKQFKKGGRRGDATMGRMADTHKREEKSRIELKEPHRGGGLGGGGGFHRGGGAGGGGGHGLLLLGHEDLAAAAPRARRDHAHAQEPAAKRSRREQPPHEDREAGRVAGRHDRRERERHPERERDRQPERERDRGVDGGGRAERDHRGGGGPGGDWQGRPERGREERAGYGGGEHREERGRGREERRDMAGGDTAGHGGGDRREGRRDGAEREEWRREERRREPELERGYGGGRDRERGTGGEGGREREGDRGREKDRERERDRGGDRDGGRERERERGSGRRDADADRDRGRYDRDRR